MSASLIDFSISVEKNRFLFLHLSTTSFNPGSKIGKLLKSSSFHEEIFLSSISITVTIIFGHLSAMTDMVGPPTYPAPMQQIFFIKYAIFY